MTEKTFLHVHVKPNSNQTKWIEKNNHWVVELREKNVEGRANVALIKLFKKLFQTDVELVQGFKSKEKIVCVYEKSEKEIQSKLLKTEF